MVIAEFLSRFATPSGSDGARDERLRVAARRFAGLISGAAAPAPARSVDSRATLLVHSGLHRGASLELSADECIAGSDDACDLVLQDPGLAPRQCRISRAADGFAIHDLRTPSAPALAPRSVRHADGVIERTYEVGPGVLLAVVQREPAPPVRAWGRRVPRERSGIRIFLRALSAASLLTGLAFLAAQRLVEHTQPAVAERIVQGVAALASQGFGAVRLRRGAGGELQVTGVVADARELDRLREWLERAHYGDAHLNVQQAADLIEQVRHALGAADLSVQFADGRLQIEGTTRELAIKERIRLLAAELQGAVDIVDRVAYVDARERPPQPRPLPVRIRDVMIGRPSYFRTDTGARYYEGALLPDGAEVLAIEASQIRFRREDQIVVYNLD